MARDRSPRLWRCWIIWRSTAPGRIAPKVLCLHNMPETAMYSCSISGLPRTTFKLVFITGLFCLRLPSPIKIFFTSMILNTLIISTSISTRRPCRWARRYVGTDAKYNTIHQYARNLLQYPNPFGSDTITSDSASSSSGMGLPFATILPSLGPTRTQHAKGGSKNDRGRKPHSKFSLCKYITYLMILIIDLISIETN